ncbi:MULTISPECIES: cytochrome b [Deefgea]|uniref:Cytochrome b n=2 Tax=Deefgea TaxID=400947 RepID=A0A6M8SP57_9NEIS|nr:MULTISPECIES: cytochrome b [Deefgea]MCB5196247.1 cytochrome b [Deefgea salmonis]QKJ65320.1 cytochrome b [Deefgea piscis]
MKHSAPKNYDHLQISLHWLMALLIIAGFILAWVFDDMPLSPDKFKMINWHKWTGITVLGLFFVRFGYKLLRGTPVVDPELPAIQRKLALGVHHLLYFLMFLLPVVGWLMSSAKGFSVVYFGVFKLPDLIAKNEQIGNWLVSAHELIAYTLLALIVLHVAGAIKHQLIDKDGTLARMLPFLNHK